VRAFAEVAALKADMVLAVVIVQAFLVALVAVAAIILGLGFIWAGEYDDGLGLGLVI
jgi:hypothetical protein